MILKSYEVQRNIEKKLKHNFYLLYGENVGLKKDLKQTIKTSVEKKDNNIEILSLYENEILDNEEIFYDFVYSGSLFGSTKIINIFGATDKIIKN